MREWIFTIVCLLTCSQPVLGASFSLQEAMTLARQQNPTLQDAALAPVVAGEEVARARGAELPQIDLNGGYTVLRDAQAFTIAGRLLPTEDRRFAHASLVAEQTLYDFGRTAAKVARAEALVQGAQQRYRGAEQAVLLETVVAYYRILEGEHLLQTATEEVCYKKHIAVEWQDGTEEASALAFVRDVLRSDEPMFGGAGNYYERQRECDEVMPREEVIKQMKAGLLAYREGPLGGCTRPGVCETRKGLTFIDTVCAADGCKHLIGKHSKIVQTIRLKRAAMTHITPGSITEAMEREELEALERVEREWRPQAATGDGHA